MSSAQILVPATLPPTPLVLADAKFLVELALVEKTVSVLSVTDATKAQEAANLLRQLTTVGGSLEKTRGELKKPFLDISRKIDETARLVNLRIESAKSSLRKGLGDWNAKEEARLAAERRRRDEELLALERQQEQEAEAERQRVAALTVATPVADALDFDFDSPPPIPKTETEQRIEQLKYAPAPCAAKPAGVGFKATLKFKVTDLRALPEDFKIVMANEAAIRQALCHGYKDGAPLPVVTGLEFWVERTAVSTGRVAS